MGSFIMLHPINSYKLIRNILLKISAYFLRNESDKIQ